MTVRAKRTRGAPAKPEPIEKPTIEARLWDAVFALRDVRRDQDQLRTRAKLKLRGGRQLTLDESRVLIEANDLVIQAETRLFAILDEKEDSGS